MRLPQNLTRRAGASSLGIGDDDLGDVRFGPYSKPVRRLKDWHGWQFFALLLHWKSHNCMKYNSKIKKGCMDSNTNLLSEPPTLCLEHSPDGTLTFGMTLT